MNDLDFIEAIDKVEPYVVRISTPGAMGTGFLFAQSKNQDMVGIATAAHVINYAYLWEQPIRIQHYKSGKTMILREQNRAILLAENLDTAAIVCQSKDTPFPKSDPILSPEGKYLKTTTEIAWIGFPAISQDNLCFFSGRISTFIESQRAYLVDGVAINGVSGGPAFWTEPEGAKKTHFIGVVSAYVPNRATGESLPGLSIIRDVTQLQSVVKQIRSLDEAKEKESEVPPTANPPINNHPKEGCQDPIQ
ncbi:MAG: hypothetical protein PVG93_06510 [Phycisphaerales bacterium]|jgi:hypothetical protein